MSNPTSIELNEFRWDDPGPEPLDTWEPATIMINNEPFIVDLEPVYRPMVLPDDNCAESLPYHRGKSSWGYAGGKKCEGDCSAELSKDMQELKILILVGFNVTYKLHFHKEWSKCLIPTVVTIKPKRATFSSGSMRCGDEDVYVVYIEAERTSDTLRDFIERKYEAEQLDIDELHARQTQPIIEFCNKTEPSTPQGTRSKDADTNLPHVIVAGYTNGAKEQISTHIINQHAAASGHFKYLDFNYTNEKQTKAVFEYENVTSREHYSMVITGKHCCPFVKYLIDKPGHAAKTRELNDAAHRQSTNKSWDTLFSKPPNNKAFWDLFIDHPKGKQTYRLKII